MAFSCGSKRQPFGSAAASRSLSHRGGFHDSGRTRHNGQSVTGQQAICSRQFAPASPAPHSRHLASIAPRSERAVNGHPLPAAPGTAGQGEAR